MEQDCQTYPPSSVRRTVPLVPEAQATPLPTLWIPRRSAVVLEVCIVNWAWAVAAIVASPRIRLGRISDSVEQACQDPCVHILLHSHIIYDPPDALNYTTIQLLTPFGDASKIIRSFVSDLCRELFLILR